MEKAAEYPYDGVVASSDEEIEKHNRLFLLKKTHKKWINKQAQKEQPMAKGICQLCFQDGKVLKKSNKKEVCASCMPVMIAAKNRPEAVLAALAYFGNLPDAPEKAPDFAGPQISEEARKTAADNGWPADLVARVERLEEMGDKIMVINAAHKILFGSAER